MTHRLVKTSSCNHCECELPADARFCPNCGRFVQGTPDEHTLPASEVHNSSDMRRLGPRLYLEQVAQSGKHLVSERRFVTTLFCDVVGSTALAEALDPEDVTALMNDAFGEMIAPVHRFEGTLARLMGDGALCLFGAPISHEDDALRACKAARDIMLRFERLAERVCKQYKIPSFEVRIGISTGLTVVGEVGTVNRSEYTAMGDAVNLAARLQHAASPSEVLVCGETWKLVSQDIESCGSKTIKVRGRSQPVSVFSLDLSKDSALEHPSPTERNKYIGRLQELSLFKEALEKFGDGECGIVTLVGSVGVGKSRLLDEAERLDCSRSRWVTATCMAYMHTVSYWVVRELVRRLIGLGSTGRRKNTMTVLRRIAKSSGVGLKKASLEFSALGSRHAALSISAIIGHFLQEDLNKRETAFIKSLSAESLNQRIISEVIELVRIQGKSGKLVLVLEDLQWIDPESLILLKTLARNLSALNVLLVLESRTDQRAPIDEILEASRDSSPLITSIELRRLTPTECYEFADAFLGNNRLPAEILHRVVQAAEGNAFFLQEMLRSVVESSSPDSIDAPQMVERAGTSYVIPQTVQTAILARVDRLPVITKSALQTAAALGRNFPLPLWVELMSASLTREQIVKILGEIVGLGFLATENTRSDLRSAKCESDEKEILKPEDQLMALYDEGSECELYFTNALTQETVYGTLLYSKRKELHALAGETLETLGSTKGTLQAPLLAFHFDRGARVERAIHYYSIAARQALEMYSLDSATSLYSRALELVKKCPDLGSKQQLALVHEGLGEVNFLHSDYQSALEHLKKAIELTTETNHQTEIYFKHGKLLQKWGKYSEAKEVFERAMDNWKVEFDEQLAGNLYAELSLTHYHMDNLVLAEELGVLGLTLAQDCNDKAGIGQASNNLGLIMTKKGEWEKAEEYFTACIRIGNEEADSYSLAACYNNWGLLAVELEEWSSAVHRFECSRELFEMFDNKHGLARVYDNLSSVYYCQGDRGQAEECLLKALSILSEIGMLGNKPLPEMWQSGAW